MLITVGPGGQGIQPSFSLQGAYVVEGLIKLEMYHTKMAQWHKLWPWSGPLPDDSGPRASEHLGDHSSLPLWGKLGHETCFGWWNVRGSDVHHCQAAASRTGTQFTPSSPSRHSDCVIIIPAGEGSGNQGPWIGTSQSRVPASLRRIWCVGKNIVVLITARFGFDLSSNIT